ncbi:sialidase family protein [Streptomyces marincola]|nr:sialidase family protein [Streptomyces marincola]
MPSRRKGARRRASAPSWTAVVCTAAWALLCTVPSAGAAGPAQPPAPPESALSTPFAHHEEGYACFRIPALVTTPRGTLLAFAEGRVTDCSDIGNIDLVMKRSVDGGHTWSDLTVLRGRGTSGGFGNPVPVVDEVTGRVSLVFAHNGWAPKHDGGRARGGRSLHSMYSEDDGATWTAGGVLGPLKPAHWTWVSVGPGHGVQLRRGPHAGRLIVPGDHDTEDGRSGAQLYYSDDGGLSWRLGAVWDTEGDPHPGELTVVELVSGALYVNARPSTPGPGQYRLAARSSDGGETFDRPAFTPVPGLAAPPVSASLLRLRATDDGDPRNRLLLSAPAKPVPDVTSRRRAMTIRTSYDEGLSWQVTAKTINSARAGYSDLAELLTGEIGLLYETGRDSPHGTIRFTAFTAASLDGGIAHLEICRVPDPAGGLSWVASDRGPRAVEAAAVVNRRTPSTPPRWFPARRPFR